MCKRNRYVSNSLFDFQLIVDRILFIRYVSNSTVDFRIRLENKWIYVRGILQYTFIHRLQMKDLILVVKSREINHFEYACWHMDNTMMHSLLTSRWFRIRAIELYWETRTEIFFLLRNIILLTKYEEKYHNIKS